MVVDANVGATKGDLYANKSMSVRSEVYADGLSRHLVTIDYSLPAFNDDLARALNPGDGSYRDYLRFYLPEHAAVAGVKAALDSQPSVAAPVNVTQEHGRAVVGVFLILGLGVDLPVVEGDGLTAPLYEAAHYPGMKWPGEGGRTLIYAHARAGMFGPLFGAHVGQQIQIARPDAPTLTYTIHEYHANWPSSNTDILQPSDHEQLVLLTCTTYNPADPRIVVVAEPAS